MQYQLLLLDIDGTLRPYDCPVIPEENVRAVQAVQTLGVTVAIATGRGRGAVSDATLNGLVPDYWLCAAGAQVLDRDNRELASCPMPADMLRKAHDFCKERNYPLFLNYADGNFIHVGYDVFLTDEEVRAHFFSSTRYDPDEYRFLREPVYSGFAWMPEQEEAAFHERYPDSNVKFYFYRGIFCDIMQSHVTKAFGMDQLLGVIGIPREASAFVGDGENDVDLLRHAGISFAMGDAQQTAKDAAQYICPTSHDFGVAAVCRQLWPEAFC